MTRSRKRATDRRKRVSRGRRTATRSRQKTIGSRTRAARIGRCVRGHRNRRTAIPKSGRPATARGRLAARSGSGSSTFATVSAVVMPAGGEAAPFDARHPPCRWNGLPSNAAGRSSGVSVAKPQTPSRPIGGALRVCARLRKASNRSRMGARVPQSDENYKRRTLESEQDDENQAGSDKDWQRGKLELHGGAEN
jgi:hypothetical protein